MKRGKLRVGQSKQQRAQKPDGGIWPTHGPRLNPKRNAPIDPPPSPPSGKVLKGTHSRAPTCTLTNYLCTPHPDTLTCATCHPNQPLVAGGRGRVRRVPALHGRVRAAGAEGGRRDGAEPEVRPASAAASLPLSLSGQGNGPSTPHPLFGVATPLFACGHTEECVRSIFRCIVTRPLPPSLDCGISTSHARRRHRPMLREQENLKASVSRPPLCLLSPPCLTHPAAP